MTAVRPMIALVLGAFLALGSAQIAGASEADNDGEDEAKLRQCLEAVRKANSDARACIGVVADPCLEQPDRAGTDGMISCIDREITLWDRMLTDRFGNLIAHLDDEAGEQVRAVHDIWEDYRDKRCALGETLFPEDSLSHVWGADCVLQETGRRAIEISTLLDELNRD